MTTFEGTIPGVILLQKARGFAAELGYVDAERLDMNWINRWKRRHNVILRDSVKRELTANPKLNSSGIVPPNNYDLDDTKPEGSELKNHTRTWFVSTFRSRSQIASYIPR